MNDFPYTLSLLSGDSAGREFDIDSVSQDIFSVGRATPFSVGLHGHGAARRSSARPTRPTLGSIRWHEAVVALTGLARAGEQLDADARRHARTARP